ncbi:MAG: hypothetical protein SCJ93_13100, partial [Bacillota bacterium]|nr:hypothetical protein [Bacillota bacterium]
MSKNIKILIAVVVVAAVAVGGYFLTKDEPFQEADAFDMMKNYYKESMNITSMDEDVTFSISIDSQDPNIKSVQDILEEVEFQMNIKETLEPIKVQMDLGVIYQGEESLNLNMFIDDEKMVYDVPFIYDKAFYMSYEDYNEFMEKQGLSGQSLNMNEIMDKAMEFQKEFYSLEGVEGIEDLDFEKYENIMRENLQGILVKGEKFDVVLNKDEDDTIECQELLLTFNDDQAVDFLIPLLTEAKDDESMKNLIIAKAEVYVDFMKSFYSDEFYETAGIENPYAEIEEAIDEIETNYSQGIEDAILELEKIKAEEHQYFTTINKMGIDKDGMMRYWNMELTLYPKEIPEGEYGVDITRVDYKM